MNTLHIYAQPFEHQEAFIVGDKDALIKLRNLIDKAIEQQKAADDFYVVDGEGFNLLVLCKEVNVDAELPYTEFYQDIPKDDKTIGRYELCDDYFELVKPIKPTGD
jgi:hypothetical protein